MVNILTCDGQKSKALCGYQEEAISISRALVSNQKQ